MGGECSCGGDSPLGCLEKDVGVWNDPEVLRVRGSKPRVERGQRRGVRSVVMGCCEA